MSERLDYCPECDQERILLPVENHKKTHYCWICTECGLVVDTEEIPTPTLFTKESQNEI